MRVCVVPGKQQLPPYGGVREHILQIYKCFDQNVDRVTLVNNSRAADVVHVESTFRSPDRVDVYVCHGGFIPVPLPDVINNLQSASIIISVAEWVARKFFPHLLHKTVVIPNGVDLSEWTDSEYDMAEYILYAKQWAYCMDDFIWLAVNSRQEKFVTTVWPKGMPVPSNVQVVGLQTKLAMSRLIHNAKCLMLPGDEVCPTMALEAFACGVPVLAKAGTGAEELMRYGSLTKEYGGKPLAQGGALYANRNDLVQAINTLKYTRDYEGEMGRSKANRFFQWGYLFEKYIKTYDAIASNKAQEYLAQHSIGTRPQTTGN